VPPLRGPGIGPDPVASCGGETDRRRNDERATRDRKPVRKAGCSVTGEAAAALLGISPTILMLWEKRFGYPVPERADDGQWLYRDDAMMALRDALGRELSIAAAISSASRT
jgi:hypothetical protein